MQQVKIFKGLESDIGAMEKEINTWIRKSGAKVLAITGNIAPQTERLGAHSSPGLSSPPSDVMIIVLYESQAS